MTEDEVLLGHFPSGGNPRRQETTTPKTLLVGFDGVAGRLQEGRADPGRPAAGPRFGHLAPKQICGSPEIPLTLIRGKGALLPHSGRTAFSVQL